METKISEDINRQNDRLYYNEQTTYTQKQRWLQAVKTNISADVFSIDKSNKSNYTHKL